MTIALVIYESLVDDDRRIAEAVAEGLSARMPAFTVPVGRAPRQLGADTGLLVLGGPEAHPAPEDTGLREWLTELSTTVPGIPTAAWDTRMDSPRLLVAADHAAHSEEKLVRLRGFDLVAPAEHFVVTSTAGPLRDGEEQRARDWGARLGELVSSRERAHAGI
jgi:hypothetical protein